MDIIPRLGGHLTYFCIFPCTDLLAQIAFFVKGGSFRSMHQCVKIERKLFVRVHFDDASRHAGSFRVVILTSILLMHPSVLMAGHARCGVLRCNDQAAER